MWTTSTLRSVQPVLFPSLPSPSIPNNTCSLHQTPRFFRTLTMAHNPAMEPHKLIVLNDENEKLVGLLHDTGSKEVVIMCHGFRSSKEQQVMVSSSVALAKEGISAFRFDFSGNGESDGSFEYGNYIKEVEDLCAVVKYFKGLNRSVSAVVGHSKGGGVVLLYASKYHDVPTVVNLSGRYDLKNGISERLGGTFMETLKKDGYLDVKSKTTGLGQTVIKKGNFNKLNPHRGDGDTAVRKEDGEVMYRVTFESLMERWNTDMHEACLKIDQQCRVLTVHGSNDEVIPVEDAYEFAKVIPNHKLHIIEGANHSYSQHREQLIPVIVDFIKSCVQQDKETSA